MCTVLIGIKYGEVSWMCVCKHKILKMELNLNDSVVALDKPNEQNLILWC